jgi:fermentation-respiration switch protein FrsA (DUF1100 family)
MSHIVIRIAAIAGGVGFTLFIAAIAALAGFQTRLIFPGTETQGRPEAQPVPRPDAEILKLATKGGERVVAVFGAALTADGQPHPDASNRPTMLYFYGNGYCLRACSMTDFDRYRRLGLNVMIAEYLGYGASSGEASEQGCYETADVCYDHLMSRSDIDPRLIIAAGRSLGGAVAIDLASRRHVAGLVAFCTFTSMTAMTKELYPYAPTALLRHKFESLKKIDKVACPILLGHGRADRLVPPSMSQKLADAAKAPVTLFLVDGADHNDFYEVGADQIHDALEKYLTTIKAR